MKHIVKTYILLLFSLLVSSIGYAQEENDIIYIQEGEWGVILCGERGYTWLNNQGDTIFGFGKLLEISGDSDLNLVLAEKPNRKKGCFNMNGEIAIPFIYDKLGGFAKNGLACAAKDGKYGYIDKEGTTVIPFIYDDAHYFRKGMACVKYQGKYGCLNAKNEWLISPNYSEIKNWNDNWVLVNKNDKWAFYDKSGKQRTNFCYDKVIMASKGDDLVCFNGLGLVVKDGKFAYLNEKLQEVVPLGTFDSALPFKEYQMGIVEKQGKWGIIDSLGHFILPLEYDKIDYVSDYGSDYELFSLKKKGHIAVMSAKTKEKTEPCFLTFYESNRRVLEDGTFQNVYIAQNLENEYGCMDGQLNIVIPFEYSEIKPLDPFLIAAHGLAYGLINWQNEIVVDFVNDDIYYCQFDDLYILTGDTKAYIMDAKGNVLLPDKYERIHPVIGRKSFVVKMQDKVGVVMKDGEQIIPCEYDSISSWWEYGPSAHYVVKDKKVGVIDYTGKVLLPTEYDSLDYVTKDVVIVTKDSKYGAVDINNRLVLPFEYNDIRFDIEEWCATGYEYVRYIYVRKDKKYYKYDRETHTMEVMLQKSIIDKIFKNYL